MPKPNKKLKSKANDRLPKQIETVITARFITPEDNEESMRVELNLKRGQVGGKPAKFVENYVGNLEKVKRKK